MLSKVLHRKRCSPACCAMRSTTSLLLQASPTGSASPPPKNGTRPPRCNGEQARGARTGTRLPSPCPPASAWLRACPPRRPAAAAPPPFSAVGEAEEDDGEVQVCWIRQLTPAGFKSTIICVHARDLHPCTPAQTAGPAHKQPLSPRQRTWRRVMADATARVSCCLSPPACSACCGAV